MGSTLRRVNDVTLLGETKVAESTTLGDIKQVEEQGSEFFSIYETLGGAATYTLAESATVLTVPASAGARVIVQTKQRYNYYNGEVSEVERSTYDFQAVTNAIKRHGYFSSTEGSPYRQYDGYFLEASNDGNYYINVYKDGVQQEREVHTNWNGENINVADLEQNQLFLEEFAWLGVAGIAWGIYKEGRKVIFHKSWFHGAAAPNKGVFMRSPNQPLRWEIESLGAAATMTFICASVKTTGTAIVGKKIPITYGSTALLANTAGTQYVFFDLRLKQGNLYNILKLVSGTIMGTTNNDPFLYEILLNATFSTGVPTYNDLPNTPLQGAFFTETTTITGYERRLGAGYIAQRATGNADPDEAINIGVNLDNVSDRIALSIIPLSGGLLGYGSLDFRKLS